jgi:hypothetical protein
LSNEISISHIGYIIDSIEDYNSLEYINITYDIKDCTNEDYKITYYEFEDTVIGQCTRNFGYFGNMNKVHIKVSNFDSQHNILMKNIILHEMGHVYGLDDLYLDEYRGYLMYFDTDYDYELIIELDDVTIETLNVLYERG